MITLSHPWLSFDLGSEMQVLSWSVNRPGLVRARHILWREVRNADLPPELDVNRWLDKELATHGTTGAVTMLTSRDITCFTEHTVQLGEITAHAVATVGLSNAERIGHRVGRAEQGWGTINIALRLNRGLSAPALLEALSIVVQARTAAVTDMKLPLPHGPATGTGTDCVAVASPAGSDRYAGLHTETGKATGRAVYTAIHTGARQWMNTIKEPPYATS